MKRFAVLAILFLAFGGSPARAQNSADDQYVVIYSYIQQADSLGNSGQPRDALRGYAEAQGELKKFQKVYPDWNPKIVNFRLNYLANKIAELTPQIPVPPRAPPPAPVTNAVPPAANADFQAQLSALQSQVQSLSANNTTLEARLKEALGAQPTMVDSRELAKAQEQIRALMKEDDLLKTSLAQSRAGKIVVDTNAVAQAQAALAELKKKLSGESARAEKLADENSALQMRIKDFLAGADAMDALRAENALLKKQLAESQLAATNQPSVAGLTEALAKSQLQVSLLQSNADIAALEKSALEQRVRQLQSLTNAPATPPAQTENETRIRDLTQERDNLLAKLDAANKQLYGGSRQEVAARVGQLTDEINTLRARLSVDEAPSVPYTPEEAALLNQPKPLRANPDAEKKSITEMPAGTAVLVAAAQHHFAARQYDQAEDDYLQILQHDQNNGLVLANLATIELQQNKLDAAEKHIQAALAQSPDDAYNLSILGYLKFQQEKYDDALDVLSRAAKLDPRNPEIQNYLGVTLGHKGLRTQAETALRKAIQLDPNYAAAHNNLAVIYINQQPPLVQLARWHYQKALDTGQPHNLELEKKLADQGSPVSQ